MPVLRIATNQQRHLITIATNQQQFTKKRAHRPSCVQISAMVDLRGRGAADYVQVIAGPSLLENASMPTGIAWYVAGPGSLLLQVAARLQET